MFGPEAAPRVLTEEQLEAVHDRAMRILEEIGTDVVHEGACDLDGGRRAGTIADHDALVRLTQASDLLACVQSGAVEAQDLEVEHHNLDMDYSCLRWSDKPFIDG